MDGSLIDFTKPVYTEQYQTLQFVRNERDLKEKDFYDHLYIFVPSIEFFFEYSFLFLLSAIIAIGFSKLSSPDRPFRTVLRSVISPLESISFKNINFLTIFLLFVVVFKFIIQQLLQNNIKTQIGE